MLRKKILCFDIEHKVIPLSVESGGILKVKNVSGMRELRAQKLPEYNEKTIKPKYSDS